MTLMPALVPLWMEPVGTAVTPETVPDASSVPRLPDESA